MGLDDFITEEPQDTGPVRPDNVPEDASEVLFHSRLFDPSVCPACGEPAEDTPHWYKRCTSPLSECEVITFIP